MSDDSRHVYPVSEEIEHNTEGYSCLCRPKFHKLCDECMEDLEDHLGEIGVERLHANPWEKDLQGCWKCVNGLIEISEADAIALDTPVIVVHNRMRKVTLD